MSLDHFILLGNGSCLNRGCEAIVRGTMAILRQAFGGDAIGETFSPVAGRLVLDQEARIDGMNENRRLRYDPDNWDFTKL
jgi:hypothetical protein